MTLFGRPAFRRVVTSPARIVAREGAGGAIYLEHPDPLPPPPANLLALLADAERAHGASLFIAERDGEGWARLTYREFAERVGWAAAALRRRGVGPGGVVAIVARNSIAHAVSSFAVMALGGVAAPLSPAYAALAGGTKLLRSMVDAAGASLLLLDAAGAALQGEGFPDVAALDAIAGERDGEAFDIARAADTISSSAGAKIMFTSGSSGAPKPLLNTHGMLTASAVMAERAAPSLPGKTRPVLVDWLPWHHTYGGNINLHVVMLRGGALYLDDGAPTPSLIARTLHNTAEVQPTSLTNVPAAYPLMVEAFEKDRALARRVLKNVRYCSFGGAALSAAVVGAFQRVAVEAVGRRIAFSGGYGMTETGGIIATVYWPTERADLLGLPAPGGKMKLIPLGEGRYECRVAGPNVFEGYLESRPDCFDAEGYFRTNDAVRAASPGAWEGGLVFDGRLGEDFKLGSGVWVRAGAMREALLNELRPLAREVLICGANRDGAGALVWLAPEHARDEGVRAACRRFNERSTGASTRISRIAVAQTPLDVDELTAKGTVNVARATQRRRAEIDAMFDAEEARL